jgi:hypothetical protein
VYNFIPTFALLFLKSVVLLLNWMEVEVLSRVYAVSLRVYFVLIFKLRSTNTSDNIYCDSRRKIFSSRNASLHESVLLRPIIILYSFVS